MTTVLADACADLETWLPRARVLLAHPDIAPTTGHAAPGSSPPWNAAVADALFGPHEAVRRLEASLRLAVTGHTGARRSGSDGSTIAAIRASVRLAYALRPCPGHPVDGKPCRCDWCRAVAMVRRLVTVIQQLPAIDEAERWRKIAGAPCPYCGVPMLLAAPQSGRVTCLRYGACFDSRDCHPTGVMAVGDVSGQPMIAWADGFIQVPAEGTP